MEGFKIFFSIIWFVIQNPIVLVVLIGLVGVGILYAFFKPAFDVVMIWLGAFGEWLKTPLGKQFITVVVAGSIAFGIFQAGVRWERKTSDVEKLKSQLATAQADNIAAREALAEEQKRTRELAESDTANQEKLHAYEEELQKRGPAGVCALNPDDVKRLRGL